MTKEQLAELRKLANQATFGPWAASGSANDRKKTAVINRVIVDDQKSGMDGYCVCGVSNDISSSDMTFIAAFNPVTAIALLDRIAELEKQAEALIDIALISHFGGLANLSGVNALIAIRSITLPFFNDVSHYTIQEQERLVNRAMVRTLKN